MGGRRRHRCLFLEACRRITTWLAARRSRQIAPRRPGTGKVEDDRRSRTKEAPASRRPGMLRLPRAASRNGAEEIEADDVGGRREGPSGRLWGGYRPPDP